MATYAWTIDRVNVRELGDDMADEKGIAGPRDADPDLLAELAAGGGYTFRMLDDDGIWYYRGRIAVAGPHNPPTLSTYSQPERRYYIASVPWDEIEAFGPLHDFGMPNAGCTTLEYRVDDPSTIDGGKPARVWAIV